MVVQRGSGSGGGGLRLNLNHVHTICPSQEAVPKSDRDPVNSSSDAQVSPQAFSLTWLLLATTYCFTVGS